MTMTPPKSKSQIPGVKYQPAVQRGFKRGMGQLVRAIAPTLGPRPRHVVHETMFQGRMPEFLDDGATIARRIVALPDRVEDAGAMILREMLWAVHETAGDGTATAAVLFGSIYNQGLGFVAAGGNGMLLRRHLEQAAQDLLAEIDRTTRPLEGKEGVRRFAEGLCHDTDLAEVVAEALDLLGPDGRLDIRPGRDRKLRLELFDGVYWDSGLFARDPTAGTDKISLVDPAFLLTDLEIKEPAELIPALDLACQAGINSLVLVAHTVSERALTILQLPANRQRLNVAAVRAPANHTSLPDSLADMALLVGGQPLLAATGDRLEAVRMENFGGARRAWADKEYLGLEAGKGDPRELRRRLGELRAQLANCHEVEARTRLRSRIGRLLYGSGVLWIGAATPLALEARKETAQRVAEAARGALREGVVAGGGIALLNLKPFLQTKICAAQSSEERLAHKILLRAVQAPFRTLLANSGHEPETILAELAQRPAGHGFDVTRAEYKDLAAAGIVDSAAVVKAALHHAVASSALALSIDVLVQRANPPMGIQRQ